MRSKPELNAAQKQAVNHQKGTALVVAGAGTGKTSVLVERFLRLLKEGAKAEQIVLLTFTEKAASEMVERINQALGHYELEAPVTTFNAYGESLLRRYAADIGLGRNFNLMGESAQIVFLRERLDQLGLDYFAPISRPDALLGDLRNYFSLLKQRVITPEAHQKFVSSMKATDAAEKLNKVKYLELATAYGHYIELCREANVIDYDDQIYLLLELFERRPNILAEVQADIAYVMVDEFQDTNTMQAQLVQQISGQTANLLVVGDDDQSIYGWRGATLANILQFKETYPKSAEITLTENYRSTSEVLNAAYKLIQNNNPERLETKLGINKQLHAQRSGHQPEIKSFNLLEEELSWVANDIKKRIKVGTNPADIAVLARRNQTIKQLHGHLDYEGVEHVLIGQRYELYQAPVVRLMLECLKAVVDPDDNSALYHSLTSPLFDLKADQVGAWASNARQSHMSIWQQMQAVKDAKIQKVVGRIKDWQQKATTLSVGELAYEILDSSGYKDILYKSAVDDPAVSQTVSRLSELFTTMKQFEQIATLPSALQYVEALPALQAAGDSGEDDTLDLSSQVVNLLTIHKAKGLEWPIVYIVDCTEGSFPLRANSRGLALPDGLEKNEVLADSHIAEERRLMYVAMTRAKDELLLSFSARHASGSIRKPSRFVSEAFGEEALDELPTHEAQTSLFAPLPPVGPFDLPDVSLPNRMLQDGRLTLTVSQLQKYLDCPLDFFYCYVLNVPQAANPSQAYGSLIHDLLQDINEAAQAGENLSLKALQDKLEKQWSLNGHLSIEQRERAKKRAQDTLKQLYERTQSTQRIPVSVEDSFRFSIPDAKLIVIGRFDVVFPLGDSVEIVDYKTSSSVDTPEKAKSRASASQQLAMYALAWQKMHDELPALVSLDFVDTGMVGSVRKTQKGIDGLVERLTKAAEGLRTHDFRPGKDHLFCIHPPV